MTTTIQATGVLLEGQAAVQAESEAAAAAAAATATLLQDAGGLLVAPPGAPTAIAMMVAQAYPTSSTGVPSIIDYSLFPHELQQSNDQVPWTDSLAMPAYSSTSSSSFSSFLANNRQSVLLEVLEEVERICDMDQPEVVDDGLLDNQADFPGGKELP